MSRCSRCSRARSRACGSRCRPRSRSTISTMRWRRPSSARWRRCRAQGALIERIEVPEFLDVGVDERQGRLRRGGKLRLAPLSDRQPWRRLRSPGVASASCAARAISAADYIDLLNARKLVDRARPTRASRPMTRWCCRPPPTRRRASPISPTTRRSPRRTCCALRNCTLINMIDGCAISLPCHREGEVPVGLMLAAAGGSDRRIFELAAGMENVIRV